MRPSGNCRQRFSRVVGCRFPVRLTKEPEREAFALLRHRPRQRPSSRGELAAVLRSELQVLIVTTRANETRRLPSTCCEIATGRFTKCRIKGRSCAARDLQFWVGNWRCGRCQPILRQRRMVNTPEEQIALTPDSNPPTSSRNGLFFLWRPVRPARLSEMEM